MSHVVGRRKSGKQQTIKKEKVKQRKLQGNTKIEKMCYSLGCVMSGWVSSSAFDLGWRREAKADSEGRHEWERKWVLVWSERQERGRSHLN